jgi:hypothetical protein
MTGMEITSLSLILFSVIIIVLGIVKVHTYPGQIALQRNHPQAKAIEVCSLLGLIVFPLWMAALIWAYAGTIGTPLPAMDEDKSAAADVKAEDSGSSGEADEDV